MGVYCFCGLIFVIYAYRSASQVVLSAVVLASEVGSVGQPDTARKCPQQVRPSLQCAPRAREKETSLSHTQYIHSSILSRALGPALRF